MYHLNRFEFWVSGLTLLSSNRWRKRQFHLKFDTDLIFSEKSKNPYKKFLQHKKVLNLHKETHAQTLVNDILESNWNVWPYKKLKVMFFKVPFTLCLLQRSEDKDFILKYYRYQLYINLRNIFLPWILFKILAFVTK